MGIFCKFYRPKIGQNLGPKMTLKMTPNFRQKELKVSPFWRSRRHLPTRPKWPPLELFWSGRGRLRRDWLLDFNLYVRFTPVAVTAAPKELKRRPFWAGLQVPLGRQNGLTLSSFWLQFGVIFRVIFGPKFWPFWAW